MSGCSSSYNTYESEDESTGWLMSSETSVDDELSDELTLLNGDEDTDEDTSSFEALIKLSMRLKKQYNLREAAVQLERCDKIWDTMQLVKQMQMDNELETDQAADGDNDEEDETEEKYTPPIPTLRLPEGANSAIPYIKYQPVQGNGNNALPNFYLAVKSQKKLYNCVTCGRQYSEERSLRLHSQNEHGVVMPKATKKNRRTGDMIKSATSQESAEYNKTVNNFSSKDRDTSKSQLSSSTEQKSQRKRERKNTDNSSVSLPELKKEPETKWSDDNREKPYICSICGTAYTYQRSMTTHMINVHDLTLEEARLKFRRGDLITTTTKPISKKVIPEKLEEVKKESTDPSPRPRYIYTCKPCGKTFPEKNYLRAHASKIHDIVIPLQRKLPLRVEGQIKYYTHYTCQIKRPSGELSKERIELTKENDKSSLSKSITKDEIEQPRTMRSRRIIVDGSNRPRRACAANTSYTECTKEEEEALQQELISSKMSGESRKSSNSQITPCFLCKKSFVDIRKHLVDYHRINCPETIIPLATNVVESEKDTSSVASSDPIATLPDRVTKKNPAKVKGNNEEFNDQDEYIQLLSKKSILNNNGRKYQCLLCFSKYNRRDHVKRHLNRYTINGVVQGHTAAMKRKRKKQIVKDPLVDPLAITDFTDSAKSESQENPNDEDDAQNIGRNLINDESENKRLGFEHVNKRRKIEEPRESIINPSSDSMSDGVQQYNNERETVLVMAETDSLLNQQDEKTDNPRDTRESSDRDSGIGISITIKKRNNSYEVVEKDSGDDDKSKDFEHSKDDNTSSDSSSDVTPVIFVNDDQEARRREILHSLDYSMEENVVEPVRDDGYVLLDAYDKKTEDQTCSSDDKEAKCIFNNQEHYGKDACASLLGNVPTLKVMCKNLLKKDELTNLNSNNLISHQCPVCYRFYPTERDVTVHMLEHKVSRIDFRATRVHAIPSSALRRYGRRAV